jgi:hypothetical protein
VLILSSPTGLGNRSKLEELSGVGVVGSGEGGSLLDDSIVVSLAGSYHVSRDNESRGKPNTRK